MVLYGLLAVSLLDLIGCCGLWDLKHFIVVSFCHISVVLLSYGHLGVAQNLVIKFVSVYGAVQNLAL